MEYQAKELFAKHDVPVTLGAVVENADDAAEAARGLGGRVVVKAQVKTGGRGKAGGVKLARSLEEVRVEAERMFRVDNPAPKPGLRRVLNEERKREVLQRGAAEDQQADDRKQHPP